MAAPPRNFPDDDSALPPADHLSSVHKPTYDAAWNQAYPILWEWGMRVVRRRMKGAQLDHEREDLVITAIEDFRRRLLSGKISTDSEIFIQ